MLDKLPDTENVIEKTVQVKSFHNIPIKFGKHKENFFNHYSLISTLKFQIIYCNRRRLFKVYDFKVLLITPTRPL
jgi:hypothetical protein